MSIVKCKDCELMFDSDFDEGSFSDEGEYLCDKCSEKEDEYN